MKKTTILGASLSSLALAAVPTIGAFAAEAGTITDTLKVEIPASCTVVNNNSSTGGSGANPALTNSYTVEMTNGQFKTDIGAANQTPGTTADNSINVSCNTGSSTGAASTWRLTAIGAGATGHTTELYGTAGSINTGTANSGGTSAWAFKVAAGSSATYHNDYNSGNGGYAEVPATEMNIATGSGNLTDAFTITYQVYVNQTQATGEYTGAVKYTLYNPAN